MDASDGLALVAPGARLHFVFSSEGKRAKALQLLGNRKAAGTLAALASRALGLSLGVCRGLALSPWRCLSLGLRVMKATTCYGAAACLCAFFPHTSKLLGLLAVLRRGGTALGFALPHQQLDTLLFPLHLLAGPFLTFTCMWALMPLLTPGLWRSLMYWQRCMPLASSFVMTDIRAKRACRRGDPERSQALWQLQHEAAAERMFLVLCQLKGFYLKLGQILATKTEFLPPTYTASLMRLLDKLPATPFYKVRRNIEKELGGSLSCFFACIDPFPLASATVAQVHEARLVSGDHVVLKLQHRGARRMMSADLSNLRLCCAALDALHVNLGFDLSSVVKEYCEQVPLEFKFEREAAMAESIRATIEGYAEHFPLLRQVLIPEVLLSLSTPRLLTMQHMDGVPILDIAGMDVGVKEQLMSAVVLAFGVMILRAGLFHSDPHPGNLLACSCSGGLSTALLGEPDIKVAILDFGQVKELSDASRLRYALLVCALASREDHLVVATMREIGLEVHNCSHEFEAIAGYILFDTRMDFPEAHESPLDAMANEGWRSAKVPSLPQDLFMIVRVITLLRGIMHTLGVDISSALMWRPLAMQTISELSSKRQDVFDPAEVPPPAPASPRAAQRQPPQSPRGHRGAEASLPPLSAAVSPRCSWERSPRALSPSGSPRQSSQPAAAELAEFIASQQHLV